MWVIPVRMLVFAATTIFSPHFVPPSCLMLLSVLPHHSFIYFPASPLATLFFILSFFLLICLIVPLLLLPLWFLGWGGISPMLHQSASFRVRHRLPLFSSHVFLVSSLKDLIRQFLHITFLSTCFISLHVPFFPSFPFRLIISELSGKSFPLKTPTPPPSSFASHLFFFSSLWVFYGNRWESAAVVLLEL